MNRKPLGKPVKVAYDRTCLLCSKWTMCRDPRKDVNFACSRYTPTTELNLMDVFEKEEEEHAKEVVQRTKIQEQFNSNLTRQGVFNSTLNVFDAQTEDEEEELTRIVNNVLNSGVPVPPDIRIKNEGIDKPQNVIEWISQPEFVGSDEKPFGKQIQVLSHLFAEWCPNCSDEDYFEDVPVADRLDDILDHVVFLENGKCPKCKSNKHELVESEVLMDPSEMVGIVGQRGSKSITGTLAESYNLARWLLCPNIPATFNILPSAVITATYTATTFKQAKSSFWDPLNNLLSSSKWFKDYHRYLDEVGREFGEELYKHSETLIAYRHKNIIAAPATPSQRSLRGRTSISVAIDEAGWFKTGQKKSGGDFEMMNGQEVYIALKRSFRTMSSGYNRRFESGYYNMPKPILLMISSPSARNDLIMTRFRESQGSRSVYSFKYATWEFNPLITRKDLDEEFRVRPVESARDYGCEPPLAMGAWINDEELVSSTFLKKRNSFDITRRRIRTKSKRLATTGTFKVKRHSKYDMGAILGIDAGYNDNSFAFAIAYPTSIPDYEDDDNEDVLVGVDIVGVGEIIPTKKYPINFSRLYRDVIKQLCIDFNVAVVVSDGWQSRKIVQDLEDSLGIEYFDLRLNMENFNDYKEAMYDNEVEHPKLEMKPEDIMGITMENYPECFLNKPVSHLYYQFLTVRNTGNAVIKGDDGSTDDLLRACVIAHAGLQEEELLDICLEFDANPTPVHKPAVAAFAGGSSGGSRAAAASKVAVSASGGRMGSGGQSSSIIAGAISKRR